MTYNVFGGTLNPTLLLLFALTIVSSILFLLCIRFIIYGDTVKEVTVEISWLCYVQQKGWLPPTKRASAAKTN